jgi:DNA topoisomerase I, bacterial
VATPTKLIIVESPAKARTISKYLGKGYKVEASQGHVRDLPKSQLGVDPEQDFDLKYITIRGRGDILTKIRKEAKNATQIFLATDPDREGEAISWHLAHILNMDAEKPCRIEFHEVTKKAVQSALKHPRPINMGLVDAQQARRVLDRIVGYKISPLLWAKVKKGLSAGRVQSVATRMVVTREEEIEAFIPEEYWEVSAQALLQKGKKPQVRARLATLDGEKCQIVNQAQAENAKARIEKAKFIISAIKQGEKKKAPSAPFTTSGLQQEAGRKLGFTTQKTMQVVQSLYEGVDLAGEGTQGIVTYIRTDSVRVSEDALAAVREYIGKRFGADYLPEKPNEYKGRKNAQDAHEAIRPTDIERTPESIKASLTRDQFNLYKLIYSCFLSSQMMPAVYDTMTAELTSDNGVGLRFYGEHKKFAGFTGVYEQSSDDEQTDTSEMLLPILMQGEKVEISAVETKQFFTQPPSRYTEASLVRALEDKGIGRPSTYAPTITTIIARGYVSREKKRLYPTELGRMVTEMMEEYFTNIVDTEFTAGLENKLDEVEDGTVEWKAILRDFYPPFEKTLEAAESQIEKIEVKDEISDIPCDKCGAMMVYKMGRFGKFLACPNFPDCRNTKPILIYLDAPCPKCGARLMEKTSKKNRKFYGCEKYPECDFVSWDIPVKEKCPLCGTYMTQKRNKNGEIWHVCANESCRNRVLQAEEEQE